MNPYTTQKQTEKTIIIAKLNKGYRMFFLDREGHSYGGVGITEYDAKHMSKELNIEIQNWMKNEGE